MRHSLAKAAGNQMLAVNKVGKASGFDQQQSLQFDHAARVLTSSS